MRCLVTYVDEGSHKISLSTSDLEEVDGDMILNQVPAARLTIAERRGPCRHPGIRPCRSLRSACAPQHFNSALISQCSGTGVSQAIIYLPAAAVQLQVCFCAQEKVLAAADDNLAAAVERMERRAEEEAMYGGDRRSRQVCAALAERCFAIEVAGLMGDLREETREQR